MISLHSVIDKWPEWKDEHFSKSKAYVDLVYLANRIPEHSKNARDVWVTIGKGQLGWSIVKLSERWKWSRNKVIRYLDDLESKGLIKQDSTNVTTIITIVGYQDFIDQPPPVSGPVKVTPAIINGNEFKQTTRSVKDLIKFKK